MAKYKLKEGVEISANGWDLVFNLDGISNTFSFSEFEQFIEKISPKPSELPVGGVIRFSMWGSSRHAYTAVLSKDGWIRSDEPHGICDKDLYDSSSVGEVAVIYNPEEGAND